MLQRQFSLKHHQVLEEVYETIDPSDAHHKRVMGIVLIL
jgi:hypothetical protein